MECQFIQTTRPSSLGPLQNPNVYEAQKLNLAAYDNQSVNGKNWVFNDTEGPANKSYWKEEYSNGTYSSSLSYSASMTTSALTTNDNGAKFNAYLKSNTFTTSGTMSSSEEWWTYNVGLTGNVTIPSGVTLTIDNGVTVNLNGHALIATGGTINNNGTISGAGATIQGVSGYFGSIQSAIDYASSGQTVQVPAGSFSESPSFSSRSNITLNGQGQGTTTLNGTIYITNSSGIGVSITIRRQTSAALRRRARPWRPCMAAQEMNSILCRQATSGRRSE
ncbi:MAG: hypothetical protein M1469_02810 [Bacteroidetes bacterium]|nr:hypothetical protein [Bacteroidota bacterium]